ncbi:PQQ-binding-like beta-propeller repeat protein [bacterium]|nr:PQQ-binding-like beta-propeller repeat protein [bacterium]
MNTRTLLALLTSSTLLQFSAHAANNWPQWRGPAADGVAPAGHPPLEWSETRNVKWKVPIPGEGHSTPVVWGQRMFLLTAVPQGNSADGGRSQTPTAEYSFDLVCLDRETGKELWRRTCRKEIPHEGHHPTNSYASGSPVTDGEHVWVHYSSRGVYCFTVEGEPVWQKDFGKMQTRNGFGEGTSPALADGKLVVLWDTEGESWIAALDAKTGEQIWKQSRDERTTWSTPLIVENQGHKQVVVNATNAVRSYDLATGDLLWQCAGQTANAIPSPVTDGDLLYVMSGFRGNAAYAIDPAGRGDLSDTEFVKWKLTRGTPYVPSPLLYDGTLYFLQGNDGIFSAVNAKTGEVYFQQERLPGVRGVYASPVAAGGRIYLSSREGVTLVLEPGKEVKVLATNKLPDPIDASPVVIGDELYLRTHTHLYCISEG